MNKAFPPQQGFCFPLLARQSVQLNVAFGYTDTHQVGASWQMCAGTKALPQRDLLARSLGTTCLREPGTVINSRNISDDTLLRVKWHGSLSGRVYTCN